MIGPGNAAATCFSFCAFTQAAGFANVCLVNRLTAKCITATKTPWTGAFCMRVHS
jgi:hypothetical protein